MVTRFNSFLDKMFHKKIKDKDSDASSLKSGSVAFSAADSSNQQPFDVRALSDKELDAYVLKIMKDKDMKDPEKLLQSFDRPKKILLCQQERAATQEQRPKKFQSPSSFHYELKRAMASKDVERDVAKDLFKSLLISLRNHGLSWMEEFGRGDGFNLLINVLGKLLKRIEPMQGEVTVTSGESFVMLHEIIQCVRAILDTWTGAQYFLSPSSVICAKLIEALCILNATKPLSPVHQQSVEDVLGLLAAFPILDRTRPEEEFEVTGFDLLIRDLFSVAEKRDIPKFFCIVDCFKYVNANITYRALILINTMLSFIDDGEGLSTRIIWRNELLLTGLKTYFQKIEAMAKKDQKIRAAYNVFQDEYKADLDEYASRVVKAGGVNELAALGLPSVPPTAQSSTISPPEVRPAAAPTPSSAPPPPPPPPPNLLGNATKASVPPPPAPPPPNLGSTGAPPPPAPPPPPQGKAAMVETLPAYLKPKPIPSAEVPLRKIPWKAIVPVGVGRESVWAQIGASSAMPREFFELLAVKFAIPPPRESFHTSASSVQTRIKKPIVIQDAKSLQALAILQGSCKLSHKEWRRAILQLDERVLDSGLIGQLRAVLPPVDVLRQLKEVATKEFDNMVEGEQFVSVLASIDGLPIRLESMELKINWRDAMDELKASVSTAAKACDEVRESHGLRSFLSLLLFAGNFMSGGKAPNAKEVYAFELSVLAKLNELKDKSGEGTLLHAMIEAMEKGEKRTDFIARELRTIEKTSRVDLQEMSRSRDTMKASLKKVSSYMATYKKQGELDHFHERIPPFLEKAAKDVLNIDVAWDEMQAKWTQLQGYLSIDPKKCTMATLFADLRTFADHYEGARRELEAKKSSADKRHPFKPLQSNNRGSDQPRGPLVTENHGLMDEIERYLERNKGGSNARTANKTKGSRRPTEGENSPWSDQRR